MTHTLGTTGHRSVRSDQPRAVRIARSFLSLWQPDTVITGMAIGWDQAVATACLDLGIPYRAYIPGKWQPDAWPPPARAVYERLLARAAAVRVCVVGSYGADAMRIRNTHIINDSEMLLALWDGTRAGGTWHCWNYAVGKGLPRINLWEAWLRP